MVLVLHAQRHVTPIPAGTWHWWLVKASRTSSKWEKHGICITRTEPHNTNPRRYLALVAREGVQRSIHNEMAALQRLRFDYRDKMVSISLLTMYNFPSHNI